MEPDAYTLHNDIIGGGDSPADELWEGYGKPLVDFNTEVSCDYGAGSVAEQVLLAFDIPYEASTAGFSHGNLADMDIKRMDAMTAINMSLMEAAFLGNSTHFIEPIVNEDGKVEFITIGEQTVNITDVYYEIQTSHYTSEPAAIMVTGGRPIPELLPIEWKPIWHGEPNNEGSIYSSGSMLANCMQDKWKSYANIIFNDPHLDSAYDDGIDNLYEITAPFDRIVGYSVYVEPSTEWVTKKTTIGYTTESDVPILISTMDNDVCPIGTLQKLPVIEEGEDPTCWQGMTGGEANYNDGVPVLIPEHFRFENKRGTTVDKFINISGVYVIGREIEALYARPKDNEKSLLALNDTNSNVWVSIEKTRRSTFKMEETKHYTVAYDDLDGDGFQEVSIVFAKETRINDDVTYGDGPEKQGQPYRLDPFCALAEELEDELGQVRNGTILPMNKTMGILVEEIWVTGRMETHAITIYDPAGKDSRALEIAKDLKYYLGALIMREMPNPIAFKSATTEEVIDLVPSERDNDPTTSQDFTNTPYELAMDEMQGSGMTVSYSFLDGGNAATAEAAYEAGQQQCLEAAMVLYNMINDDVTETVYTCGPNSRPKLGNAGPAGGVINGIKYQYNDQGSYTISVT